MPRSPRAVPPNVPFHVLNRANRRARLFERASDYDFFLETLAAGVERAGVELFAFCVMPNHWHLVVTPQDAQRLATFLHWTTTKHALALHAYNETTGVGHVYQGRYRAFPVQSDEHFLTLCRYVERNPVRAGLVTRAADWPWSSHRANARLPKVAARVPLREWPVERPFEWAEWVDHPQTEAELADVRRSVSSGQPFGSKSWRDLLGHEFQCYAARNSRGRPRKVAWKK
jgi:putative transposase